MFPYLRAAQFDPHIVFEPVHNTEVPDVSGLGVRLKGQGFRIVFFQKVYGDSVLALVRELHADGVRTVFGVCDVVEPSMVAATDVTITVTDYLKSLHPVHLHPRITTVHDGIERPELSKKDWGLNRGSRAHPLRAVLVTSMHLDHLPVIFNPPPWLHVTIVGRYARANMLRQRIREFRWELATQAGWRAKGRYLRFILNPRIQRKAWDSEGVYDAMLQADIGIIPIDKSSGQGEAEGWQVKSENRLTLKMAVGLPVVASPIPSYGPVVDQGKNAFLANDRAEWLSRLTALRDPNFRRAMGEEARLAALKGYSMALQAEKMVKVLRSLIGESR